MPEIPVERWCVLLVMAYAREQGKPEKGLFLVYGWVTKDEEAAKAKKIEREI